jgi:hypothetical protein
MMSENVGIYFIAKLYTTSKKWYILQKKWSILQRIKCGIQIIVKCMTSFLQEMHAFPLKKLFLNVYMRTYLYN